MPRLRHLTIATAAMALLTSGVASAGVRIWENNANNPDLYQYFDIGGFIQPGFYWQQQFPNEYGVPDTTGFFLQRARVNFQLQLTKYFIVRMELEMVGFPNLQDAYLESDPFPWLNFKFGQFLVPFLESFQYNEANISFLDRPIYVPTNPPNQPFLSYLVPRDIGLSITGLIGNPSREAKLPVLEYGIGVFNGKGPNQPVNPNGSFEYTARLLLHLLGVPQGREWESDLARNKSPHVAVGVGGYTNCDLSLDAWERGVTTDAEFRYEGIYVSGSFLVFRNGRAPKSAPFGYGYTLCGTSAAPSDFMASGGHVQAQYLLPPALFGPTGGGLEILGRFDQVTPDAEPTGPIGTVSPRFAASNFTTGFDAKSGAAPPRWRLTFGVNWYPIHLQSLRVALNYSYTQTMVPFVVGGSDVSVSPSMLWFQITAGI